MDRLTGFTGSERSYSLKSGFEIEFDPNKTLPPEGVSEMLGLQAARVARAVRFLDKNKDRPLRLLDIGTGTGICLASCLSGLKNQGPVYACGFDKDAASVHYAKKNLIKICGQPDLLNDFTVDIREADWSDQAVWESELRGPFDVIMFNPPYHPKGADIRHGYENVPSEMIFTNDETGLEHYQAVLPKALQLLSAAEGASILLREPKETIVNSRIINEGHMPLFDNLAVGRQESGRLSVTTTASFVAPDRPYSLTTISRVADNKFIAAHDDTSVIAEINSQDMVA